MTTSKNTTAKTLAQRYHGGYLTAQVDEKRIGRAYVAHKARRILSEGPEKYAATPHWALGYVDAVEGVTPQYTEIDCV